ncbi:MAG: pectate lyase [Pseudomonadota bacterium]
MQFATVRRLLTQRFLLAAAVLALAATSAHAVPVIPGAAGFGMDNPAGRGGTVIKVTNLNASGPGSLKACASDFNGPRVCVFEVSGVIRITEDMMIRWNNITIAGQTAPSPGIMIRGAALRIQASNVLVQHIRVRAGDDPNGPDPANRDSLKIEGTAAKPVANIVIDHCSFGWAVDEIASVWGVHDNVTFTNNIFAEPLNQSIHPTDDGKAIESHGFGVIFGSSPSGGRVTLTNNLMADIVERNPLSRTRELVMVNNVVYNRVNFDVDLQSEKGISTRNSVVGNVFLKGPSFTLKTKPIYLRTKGSFTLLAGSKVYVKDNYAPENGGSAVASLVQFTGGDIISGLLQTATAPTWNTGLNVRTTANNAVYNSVLKYAGARPSDRDAVEKRIVKQVQDRKGAIINCVASNGSERCKLNAGGWPSYAQNTRKLTIPANPGTMTSNGYTNLENWLHSMDQTVQGVTAAESPTSPPSLSVR